MQFYSQYIFCKEETEGARSILQERERCPPLYIYIVTRVYDQHTIK